MFNIKPIEQVIQNRVKKISIPFKTAFTSGIIVGLLAHLYMFMNKFPNYDDMAINSFGASLKTPDKSTPYHAPDKQRACGKGTQSRRPLSSLSRRLRRTWAIP